VSSNGIDLIGYVSNPALALDLHHNGWKFGPCAGPVFGTADYHDYLRRGAARCDATRPRGMPTGFGGTSLYPR
jgi:hypothetical protein